MTFYFHLITGLWVVLMLVWLVSAMFAKRTVSGNLSMWFVRIAMVVVVWSVFGFNSTTRQWLSLPSPLSPLWQLVGVALCAVGVAIALWARFYLGRNWGMPMSVRENPELVTGGPYAYVRNPIYTGFLLAMLGSAMVGGTLWWLSLFAFAAIYFTYSATQEEKIMLREFPDTYPAYKARTKMLIPWVF